MKLQQLADGLATDEPAYEARVAAVEYAIQALRCAHADLKGMVTRIENGIEANKEDLAAARKTISEIEELVEI